MCGHRNKNTDGSLPMYRRMRVIALFEPTFAPAVTCDESYDAVDLAIMMAPVNGPPQTQALALARTPYTCQWDRRRAVTSRGVSRKPPLAGLLVADDHRRSGDARPGAIDHRPADGAAGDLPNSSDTNITRSRTRTSRRFMRGISSRKEGGSSSNTLFLLSFPKGICVHAAEEGSALAATTGAKICGKQHRHKSRRLEEIRARRRGGGQRPASPTTTAKSRMVEGQCHGTTVARGYPFSATGCPKRPENRPPTRRITSRIPNKGHATPAVSNPAATATAI